LRLLEDKVAFIMATVRLPVQVSALTQEIQHVPLLNLYLSMKAAQLQQAAPTQNGQEIREILDGNSTGDAAGAPSKQHEPA
jgi:hypothetical protein